MLGLRHYLGVAIDLWLGDITEFAVDAMVQVSSNKMNVESAELSLPNIMHTGHVIQARGSEDYFYCLSEAQRLQARHLSFPPLGYVSRSGGSASGSSVSEEAEIAMNCIKDFISEQSKKSTNLIIKRITFVLNEKQTYIQYQQALFSTFLSEESE